MADGKILYGQQYLVEDGIIVPFTQQMRDVGGAAAQLGDDATEITPHQEDSSLVRTYSLGAIQDAFLSTHLISPISVNVQLPDVLTSIDVTCDTSGGDGASNTNADGIAVGTSVSLSLSPRSSASSSGAVMPDIQPNITAYFTPDAKGLEVLAYTIVNPTEEVILRQITLLVVTPATFTVTIASPGAFTWTAHGMANGDPVIFTTTGALPTGLLPNVTYYTRSVSADNFRVAALPTGGSSINTSGSQSGVHSGYRGIKRWPQFKPQAHTITLHGENYSLSAEAGVQQQVAISGADASLSWAETAGYSVQTGLTVKTVRISPTIHGAITLAFPAGHTITISLSVTAATVPDPPYTDGTNWPKHRATSSPSALVATASISPTSLAATSPAAIPSSGYYLKDLKAQFYRYGVTQVRAVVVDFAQFA